ncbi:unnamed protein product [Orchesella dallaii]|uniref:Gustatory receptor n=1 Tax=Orchesella dallaii TaxID=48710 RepID=A0ABP1RFT6_9HEXA
MDHDFDEIKLLGSNMLETRLKKPLRILGKFYKFLGKFPICWNQKEKKIYAIPKQKWIPYYFTTFTVVGTLFTCVYTIITQLFFKRRSFNVLHACILTSGVAAFYSTIAVSIAVFESNLGAKISAVNQYLQLEAELYSRKRVATKKFVEKNRNTIDIFSIFLDILQFGNFLPYLLLFGCLYWGLDGPYWVLEDIAPNSMYRETSTIFIFLIIRILVHIPCFWESGRSILGSIMVLWSVIESVTKVVKILTYDVKNTETFFRYYSQLSILCNWLENSVTRVFLITISFGSLLFIQWTWICVRGFGILGGALYCMFLNAAFLISVGVLTFLPMAAVMGEAIAELPKIKRLEMRRKYYDLKTLANKVAMKKGVAIQPLKFQYGGFYPMGKNFSRNTFGNLMENMMAVVLLYEMEI